MKPVIACLILFSALAFAAQNDVVHHPAPKEPLFVKSEMYGSFKKALPAAPDVAGPLQKSDEKTLFELQGSRTPTDCEQAKAEVLVNLQNFFGKPRGSLSEENVKALNGFFDQVRNDGDFFIQKLKKDFPRPRPFTYIKGISPCVAKEVTLAYPSGHAMLSKLYASILADLFPADKEQIEKRASEIGKHRVLAGMHHPTDVLTGRQLADLVYVELKKSPKYQAAFNEIKTKIKTN